MQENKSIKCTFCQDTRCLDLPGIVKIFLRPRLVFLVLAIITASAAYFSTPYLYLLAAVIFLLPLARADLRLYLFLPVTLAFLLFRKKVNCPKCNPGGTLFRKDTADQDTVDRFQE